MSSETSAMIVFISESDGYRVRKEGEVVGFLRWDIDQDSWFFSPQANNDDHKFDSSLELAKEQVKQFLQQ